MTERTLVQAAQAGQPEAAGQLVERYYPRVYSFVASQKGGDAEDLTQEVFARALGALPRFNGEYQFGAWLLQIARNVCIDESRRQAHRPQPTDPVDLVEMEPTAARPDDVWESVASQIAVGTVHRAMARLPARQRTVLVLRELEGMSYADIAIALRVSTRAVEISLSRARKRMRLELKRLDLIEGEMAACRRAATLLAGDPTAVSREEVAEHLRHCSICKSMDTRRRPRNLAGGAMGAWALLIAGIGGLGGGVRRLGLLGQRLGQGVMTSSSAASMSPLSRLAEVGATVAMATAVSAGSFAHSSPAPAPVVPVPVVSVAPSQPAPLALAVPAPPAVAPAVSAKAAVVAPATPEPAQPVTTELSCAVSALGRFGVAPSGVSSSSANPLLAGLLSPAESLTPVLNCDPTLAGVGAIVSGSLSNLLGSGAATASGSGAANASGSGSASTLGASAQGSPSQASQGSGQGASGGTNLLSQLLGGSPGSN